MPTAAASHNTLFEQILARLAGELGPAPARHPGKRLARIVPDPTDRKIVANLSAAAAASLLAEGGDARAVASRVRESCRTLVARQVPPERVSKALEHAGDQLGAAAFQAAALGCFHQELAEAATRERDELERLCDIASRDAEALGARFRTELTAFLGDGSKGAERVLSPREAAFSRSAESVLRLAGQSAALRETALRLIDGEEEDRRRLSRDLHDNSAQALAVARLHLELAETAPSGLPNDVREQLAQAREQVERSILDVRRLISELSPVTLDKLGVGAAVRQIANRCRQLYGVPVKLEMGEIPPVHRRFALAVCRTVQECLTKIGEQCPSASLHMSMAVADGALRVQLSVSQNSGDSPASLEHLLGKDSAAIWDRIALIGGGALIESTRGRGRDSKRKPESVIKIRFTVPITEKIP